MFMNTIAVGPLEVVASCVTGGTNVAIDRLRGAECCEQKCCEQTCCEVMALALDIAERGAFLHRCDIGFRTAIMRGTIVPVIENLDRSWNGEK